MGLIKKLPIVSCILTLLLFNSMHVSSDVMEIEDEREFNYEEGGPIGPERWGELHKEWALCGNGTMQSPIDVSRDRVMLQPQLGPLKRTYRPAPAFLQNRGHDIMLKWEYDAGFLRINGTKYSLIQLHWHSPTEHAINGKRYDLEMHMVHQNADADIAVVGILYKFGRPDPFIAKLEKYICKVRDTPEKEVVGTVDPRSLMVGSLKYYRYMGSLTTPPCSERVVWTIVKQVRTVSRKQVHLLREAVNDGFEMNARPIQHINDRMIGLYHHGNIELDVINVEQMM